MIFNNFLRKSLIAGRFFSVAMLAYSAEAQVCELELKGRVITAAGHLPLPFAQVHVKELGRSAVADENGLFVINRLCSQAYTLEISQVEANRFTTVVELQGDLEKDFELSAATLLQTVEVREKAIVLHEIQPASTVDAASLAAASGVNLGETLRKLPGVALLNTGATIAKPVIQGLHSNRIAIVNNGVLLQSQQWGSEHAPEIDPFTADQVRVIKGAAAVRYGPGALGGIVLLDPAPLRTLKGMGGWVTSQVFNNGRGGVLAGSADWKPRQTGPAFRLQTTIKRSGNMQSPDYFLHNTGVSEINANLMSEWRTSRWTHQAQAAVFSQQLGILRSAHIGNTTDLRSAILSDTPPNNIDRFVYRIDRPRQAVEHYTLKYRGKYRFSDYWTLLTQYNFQYDNRREYDRVRRTGASANTAQSSFRLWSNTFDASVEHQPVRHWQGSMGIQALQQLNYVGRGGYIPDYWTLGGSAWATERWRNYPSPWEFEAGIRFDYRRNQVTYADGTFLPPGTPRVNRQNFANVSGSVGASYRFNQYLKLSAQSGLAWRPPHVYEAFARGIHFATATYEQGNRQLTSEKAWNTQLVLDGSGDNWSFSLNVYRNAIRDFIYLQPMADTFVLTARGAFLGFEYTQANAVLQGIDGQASLNLLPSWSVETRWSMLRGFQQKSGGENDQSRLWLPFMPGDRLQYGLKWHVDHLNRRDTWQNVFIQINASTVFEQTRLPETGIIAPPPGTYTLFGIESSIERQLTKDKKLTLGLNVSNLFNTSYRDYLDFFRYFADAPGTNVSLRGKLTF